MRRIFQGMLLLLCLVSSGYAQNLINKKPLTGIAKKDVVILLPEGQYQVDLMDKVEMALKPQQLLDNFLVPEPEKPSGPLEKPKQEKDSAPLPNPKKSGLTKEEYDALTNKSKKSSNLVLTKSGSETIIIKHTKDKIIFKGSGACKIFDDVSINLQDMTAQIGAVVLPKPERVANNSTDDEWRSKWKGFYWNLKKSNKLPSELKTAADFQDYNMLHYQITIGQLAETGKTYMYIIGSEIKEGKGTVGFRVPLIIQ